MKASNEVRNRNVGLLPNELSIRGEEKQCAGNHRNARLGLGSNVATWHWMDLAAWVVINAAQVHGAEANPRARRWH